MKKSNKYMLPITDLINDLIDNKMGQSITTKQYMKDLLIKQEIEIREEIDAEFRKFRRKKS